MTRREEWRPVPGWKGSYEVSDLGRVRSLDRTIPFRTGFRRVSGRILTPIVDTQWGRHAVVLSRLGERHNRFVHRLVLMAFVGECPPGMECCHNDGNPANNRLQNLRWDTPSNNSLDRNRHGTQPQPWTHCARDHQFTAENTIRNSTTGRKRCRTCNDAWRHQRAAKRAATKATP